jgi:hypothetical protein
MTVSARVLFSHTGGWGSGVISNLSSPDTSFSTRGSSRHAQSSSLRHVRVCVHDDPNVPKHADWVRCGKQVEGARSQDGGAHGQGDAVLERECVLYSVCASRVWESNVGEGRILGERLLRAWCQGWYSEWFQCEYLVSRSFLLSTQCRLAFPQRISMARLLGQLALPGSLTKQSTPAPLPHSHTHNHRRPTARLHVWLAFTRRVQPCHVEDHMIRALASLGECCAHK